MGDPLGEAAKQVKRGNASAFRRIVETTSPMLVRFAARMLGSMADAEDVVQESYVKAFQALSTDRFDGRSQVSTWLHRIVANASVDALRSRKRRPVATDVVPEGHDDGLASAEARLALVELSEMLDGLPPEQRVALVLKVVEGRTTPEVAEILECSEGAVEQRLVRARATLRERSDRRD